MKNLLERKYYMPFNLQLFAEGSEDDLKDESNGNDEEKKEEKKYSDSDLEQIINRKFAKWKTEQEKAEEEAKKLAEMNAQQRAEAERDKYLEELNKLKHENAIASMRNEARKMFATSSMNVSDELLDLLVCSDADKTKKAVDSFTEMFQNEVEKEVKERLKGGTPKRGSGKNVTRDSILSISDPLERQRMIAENMDLFK